MRLWIPIVAALVPLLGSALVPPAAAGLMPRWGVEEGPHFGSVGSSGPSDRRFEGRWSAGGTGAVVAVWAALPGWALEFAPGWEHVSRKLRLSQTISFSGSTLDSWEDRLITFDRVQFPLRVVRRLGRSPWSIEGGGAAGWLARGVEKTQDHFSIRPAPAPAPSAGRPRNPVSQANIFESLSNTLEVTDDYHRWDALVSGGVGWEHRLGGPTLRLRSRWQQGLTRLNKEGDFQLRLSGVSITAGLLW